MNPLLLPGDWLIQPEALRSMALAVRSFRDRGTALPKAAQSSQLLTVEDGIGTVAIDGPILRKPSLFARVLMGASGSGEISAAIREAGERDDIKAVFLDIDSPGGTVAGTPELAAAVASLNERKPVYAFSSGLMCSAAYWIASQARAIYATPSAQVGSIGVVQAVIDDSAALASEGIKVEVFSVGNGAQGRPARAHAVHGPAPAGHRVLDRFQPAARREARYRAGAARRRAQRIERLRAMATCASPTPAPTRSSSPSNAFTASWPPRPTPSSASSNRKPTPTNQHHHHDSIQSNRQRRLHPQPCRRSRWRARPHPRPVCERHLRQGGLAA
ncbi:MAG: S49 family peptidase, partial [Akkermansiaceae bacterium]|nr:S49 family peptidase [Akkermansiaceae bacterium]MCF7734519.1 S49 family peptidase [Akkermansiaceae bacterium]